MLKKHLKYQLKSVTFNKHTQKMKVNGMLMKSLVELRYYATFLKNKICSNLTKSLLILENFKKCKKMRILR